MLREFRTNQIDELVTDLLINAEKKSRQLRAGEVDYSPETSKVGKVWYFWNYCCDIKYMK